MSHVILIEPDRIIAKTIAKELKDDGIDVSVVSNADSAVSVSDEKSPDLVISELSIPGHSGSEFLYEFRTYTDWKDVPIILFSTLKPKSEITDSRDWKLLNIYEFLYKPDVSIQQFKASVISSLGL